MTFLQPIWLLGILGTIVPIVLHLLNRNEGKVVPVGSVRFLTESPASRIQKLKLTDLSLLLLRCLLIILLALLLAQPSLERKNDSSKRWIVVEEGVEHLPRWRDLIAKARADGFSVRRLLPGFPTMDSHDSSSQRLSYWILAGELQQLELDSAIVISFNYLKNFQGHPTQKPANLLWLQADIEKEKATKATVVDKDGNIWIQEVSISPDVIAFDTRKSDNTTKPKIVDQADTIRIAVYSDTDFDSERRIISASLKAIQQITPRFISITQKRIGEIENDFDWIFWLTKNKGLHSRNHNYFAFDTATSDHSSTKILIKRDSSVTSNTWIFTKRINSADVIEHHLTAQLANIILEEAKPAAEYDKRVLSEALMWSHEKSGKVSNKIKEGEITRLDHVFLVLLILSLFVERLVSYKKNA